MPGSLTDVRGILVGHWTDLDAATGCTAVLCPPATVGGASLRGFATGSRGADTLGPLHATPHVDAVMLSGGSAFGLDAAQGAMRFLEEQGRGFRVGTAVVPIVAAAILFDLGIGQSARRPGAPEGYAACRRASDEPVLEGCVGAGTGCTAGKLRGTASATKTGIGSASRRCGDVVVAALVAANPYGDIVDPETSTVIAGLRDAPAGSRFLRMTDRLAAGDPPYAASQNTALAIVATNARLDKAGAARLADQTHDAFALAIRPAHTLLDGDAVFALSTGPAHAHPVHLAAMAVAAATEAILRAARSATSLAGLPASSDLGGLPGPNP
jgi:L-aminopeptidase/D-esterase-like protein